MALWILVLLASLLAGCVQAAAPSAAATPAGVTPAAAATAVPTSPPTPEPAAEPVETPGYVPTDVWETSTPEAQGVDSAKLAEMLEYIQEHKVRLHSLVMVRNGTLILEAYFHPYQADTHHQIASITKSVMGALIGIAIEQGKIESLQQPVADFFPERSLANLDDRKKAMTLEHLLMLAPGLDCADPNGTEYTMTQSEDWVQYVLDLPMAAVPGEKWTYCSSAVHLVSAILQQATGVDARTYANQNLFQPIGIAEVPPERWPTDPSGVSAGGNGLMLTPTEVARFALLYLNGGRWGDRQVVPAGWVAASTTPHIEVGKMAAYGNMNRSYGYLWSIYPEQGFYSALGRNGQHIHVFPKEDLVVIFNSATPVGTDERQFTLLKDFIVPSLKSQAPLPENPDSAARLQSLVEFAAAPRQPVVELPALALELNGKTIRVGDNPFGWETMVFTFLSEDGQPANPAMVQINNEQPLAIGLDNLYQMQEIPGMGTVGFRLRWDREDRFTVEEVVVGTWFELDLTFTVKGNEVTILQRNVVDGGSMERLVGTIE